MELETAVRELDQDLEGLVLKDDLKGYVLPVRENGKYGLIDTEGEKVVRVSELNCADMVFGSFRGHQGVIPHQVGETDPLIFPLDIDGTRKRVAFNEKGRFYEGVCPVKTDGSLGLINTQGEVLLESRYDNIVTSPGRTPPDDAAARFEENSRTGYLDSDGEVLFEGKIEETIGNYFIFTEEGKAGIKSIEGEVIEEPVFDDYSKSRPPGTGDPTAGHVAEDFTLFKKDGLWGVFAGGEFLTDFKFEEIGGYGDLPMEFNDVPQSPPRWHHQLQLLWPRGLDPEAVETAGLSWLDLNCNFIFGRGKAGKGKQEDDERSY